jgi:trimeric autotransporter adhesin
VHIDQRRRNQWRRHQWLACLVALCLAFATAAQAQIRSATITGTVTDATGAVLPGATVVVTNQDTNADTTLTSNDEGLFTAPYLAAGTYTVTVTLEGFSAFKRTGVILTTAQTIRVSAELKMTPVRLKAENPSRVTVTV